MPFFTSNEHPLLPHLLAAFWEACVEPDADEFGVWLIMEREYLKR
jgi:hypothetical protein